MKLFYLLAIILFPDSVTFSQDVIYFKNNVDSIKCRIIEDKITYLKYKLINSNDTTTYVLTQNQYDYYIDIPDEFTVVDNSGKKIENILEKENTGLQGDFGIGVGLDYGGLLGVKFTFIPIDYLSAFFSFGYQFIAPGVSIGLQAHLLPYSKEFTIRPHLNLMFGTNAVIVMIGAPQLNKSYVGFTPGGGFEIRFGQEKRKGFNIDLCFPIRSKEFDEDFNTIRRNPLYTIKSPTSVTISIGFHVQL